MAGQREGHLLVAAKAFHGMIECPLATFPPEHHALTPVSLERFTSLVQVLDETVNGRVVQVRAYVGAKLRHDASGAVGIIVDKRARRWFEKDETQEVPVTRSVQPPHEEMLGSHVPAAGGPGAIEDVGGRRDQIDTGEHARRDDRRLALALLGIAPSGEFEEIGPLGTTEPERARKARQRRSGERHVPALLKPGVPGDAQAAQLGRLLASQAGRPAPGATGQPDLLGVQLLALGPDKIGELAALLKWRR